MKTPAERFFAKVSKGTDTDACWIWTGARVRGYGTFATGKGNTPRLKSAHRWSYEFHVGAIPDGLTLDHTCHTRDLSCVGGEGCPHRGCVNPAHLEPVTIGENSRRIPPIPARLRRWQSEKTHCPQGHKYSPENTYVRVRADGGPNRTCRQCKRDRYTAEAAKRPPKPKVQRTGYVAATRKAWPEDLERARQLMADGASLRKAAQDIGLSHTQLRRRLLGIP